LFRKPLFERPKPTHIRLSSESAPAKPPSPTLKAGTPGPTSSSPLKPGTEYPARHTSTINVSADPIHPSTGKPITQTDLDTDFSGDNDKPWHRPGSDITDYFNYGFDEFTWASYCFKQQSLRKEVMDQKKEMEDMNAFFSGTGGMPPMPGMPGQAGGVGAAPTGMPGMPGMPELTPELMSSMMGAMFGQGLDPTTMPAEEFMRYAQQFMAMGQGAASGGQQAFPPGPQMGGQGQNQQQAGGFGGGGFDPRGGRGRGGRRW
jgi:pre-mRNA 3'-end-processing factor FIP1